MRSESRAAAKQIAPGNAARMVAKLRGGRLARRKFSEIDCARARRPNTEQQACGYHHFHAETGPSLCLKGACLAWKLRKIQQFCAPHNCPNRANNAVAATL